MRKLQASRLVRLVAGMAALALLVSSCAEEAQVNFPDETVQPEQPNSGQASSVNPDCSEDDPGASFQPDETTLQSTAADIERIKADGLLTVGVAQDTLLFGFLDAESGEIEGFDVEMARLVSTALFGNPNQVEIIPIQSSERIPKLQNRELELVIKTMTINCERWADINFSTVYYDAAQRLLVRKDTGIEEIEDLVASPDPDVPGEETGARVCAEAGTTSLNNLSGFGNVTPVPVDSIAECLVKFQQTSVDAISTDDTILAGLAVQDPFAEVVGPSISEEPYGFGTNQDDVEFTRFVNAVLEQAREDGTWQAAYNEWLADTLGDQAPPSATYR